MELTRSSRSQSGLPNPTSVLFCHTFSLPVEMGILPCYLKIADVTPIYDGGIEVNVNIGTADISTAYILYAI